MWSVVNPMPASPPERLSNEQGRMLKEAYLMGAKDALKVREVYADERMTRNACSVGPG